VSNSSIRPVRTVFDVKPSGSGGTISGQVIGNDAILCGGVASTQYHVTLMKDAHTPLSPTQPYFIASNSSWTPAAQPAAQPPQNPGFIQTSRKRRP
jgi:hypothetical protein